MLFRSQKYFEVGSCSNLGDAQARRLKIRVKGADGKKYLPHTLNNTVVAPPRLTDHSETSPGLAEKSKAAPVAPSESGRGNSASPRPTQDACPRFRC